MNEELKNMDYIPKKSELVLHKIPYSILRYS